MTRPLAVTGFTILCTLFVLMQVSLQAIGVVFFTALIAFAIFMFIPSVRKDRTLPTAGISVAVAALVLFCNQCYFSAQIENYAEKETVVSGTLCDLPYEKNGKQYYVLKADAIDANPVRFKIRLSSKTSLDLEPGDRITAKVHTFLLGGEEDDFRQYYQSKGLLLGGYGVHDVKIEEDTSHTLTSIALQLREKLILAVMRVLPNENGGLIVGLCFGTKNYLPLKVKNAFAAAGISHLLAVSGLHLSVWSMLLYGMLQKLRLNRKITSISAILFIVFFSFLTGLNPPVLRAGLMLSTVYAANLFKREPDSLNSLGLALTAMLLWNPYLATSLSLWLSMSATLGIILFSKKITAFLQRPIAKIHSNILTKLYIFVADMLAVSVSVTVLMIPIYLLKLPTLSLWLLPANLLTVTAGSLCMTIGGIAAVLSVCGFQVIATPLFLFSGSLAEYLIRVTACISHFRYTQIPINGNWSLLVAVIALVTFAVLIAFHIKEKISVKLISITLIFAFLIANLSVLALTNSKLKLTVADVGDGTAVVLKYKGRTAILGCGGNYFAGHNVCGIMSMYGSSVAEMMLLPSEDVHHLSGAKDVLSAYPVKTLYLGNENLQSEFPNGIPFEQKVFHFADETLKILVEREIVHLYFGDFHAVLSFASHPTLQGTSGDLLICQESMLKNVDTNAYRLTVVSTEKEDLHFLQHLNNILLTSQNGNISFLIDKNGSMDYWRNEA